MSDKLAYVTDRIRHGRTSTWDLSALAALGISVDPDLKAKILTGSCREPEAAKVVRLAKAKQNRH